MFKFSKPTEKTGAKRGVLTTKLSQYERHKIDRLYRANEGLFKFMVGKMMKEYPAVHMEEIISCMNVAFIKAARTHDPKKGTLGTVLYQFARGEVSHYIKTSAYWGYGGSSSIRDLGLRARRLITMRNAPMFALPKILGCTREQLREALESTLHVAYGMDNERMADEQEQEETQEDYSLV